MSDSLKLVFVSPEEPSALPVFYEAVMARIPDEIAEVARYGYYKAADLVHRFLPIGRYYSVKSLARAHGLPLLTPADVNSDAFLEQLREIGPDAVISVSCPQIFGRRLLELPPSGCI